MHEWTIELVTTITPITLYLLPTIIAFYRRLAKRYAVLACNISLAWLIIPGMVLLVYALLTEECDPRPAPTRSLDRMVPRNEL